VNGRVEGFLMAGLFINVNYIVVPIFLMLLGWDQALASWLPNGFFIDNLAVLALVYAATSLPFTVYLLVSFFRTIPAIYEEPGMRVREMMKSFQKLRKLNRITVEMAAGMVIVMVPVLLLYATIQKRLVTGIGGGGLK
jgi:N-acetylglucosamine transport system permease protein